MYHILLYSDLLCFADIVFFLYKLKANTFHQQKDYAQLIEGLDDD